MEYRTLELNLTSAKDLKDVNLFSKMEVYAVVSISGDPLHKQKDKTPVDRDGGTNPTWNFPIKITINESLARQNRLTLEIKLRCERTLAGDKDIGHVHIPLIELLNQTGDGKSFEHVSYQVRKPSGKPKGALNFSYKFGEKLAAPEKAVTAPMTEPVMAYPPPAAGSSSVPYAAPYPGGYPLPPPPQPYGGYPQPQPGYGYPSQPGYGYPPQPGYGYPPQPGYGYPPQPGYGYAAQPGYGYAAPVQKPGKNNFGMGLGAGLLGGALGGLLIGDMISDASSYDAGYDAGFDNAGGFDF